MAVLAATPAVDGVVLVVDALIDLGSPLWEGAPFTAVLLGLATFPIFRCHRRAIRCASFPPRP